MAERVEWSGRGCEGGLIAVMMMKLNGSERRVASQSRVLV